MLIKSNTSGIPKQHRKKVTKLHWLFSDRLKVIKICIPLILIVLSGIYYNHNRIHVINSREYIENLFDKGTPFQFCLKFVKIEKEDGIYYTKILEKKIELKNLPDSVKNKIKSRYSISGEIIEGTIMYVKENREISPRIYKIASSGLAALIICSLFFFFFRLSNRGIVYKRMTKNA